MHLSGGIATVTAYLLNVYGGHLPDIFTDSIRNMKLRTGAADPILLIYCGRLVPRVLHLRLWITARMVRTGANTVWI